MLSYEAARAKVIEIVHARTSAPPATENIEFAENPSRALGRILAEELIADRNYPPFDRSTRDGFAVRAADAARPGARLRLIGESRAGHAFAGQMEAVSYTHLDVYKRQVRAIPNMRGSSSCWRRNIRSLWV